MHLVYVIDNLVSGGAQRQVAELALRLCRQPGLRVGTLIYKDIDFYGDRLREAGVPVVLLSKRLRYDPTFPRRLRRWLEAQQVDLVHAFLLAPALWSLLALRRLPAARRPALVAAERSSLIATTRAQAWLQRFVYRRADAVTVNAEAVAGAIHERLGVPAERIHYLPNGIDLEIWDRQAEQESPLPLEPGRLQLALVGGLRPEKNHTLVLEALGRLGAERTRDWRVWFIGAETAGQAFAAGLRQEIEARGLGAVVRIAEPTPRIAAVLRRLDGLLLPSRYEGFPNVVLEAMAARIPVVASAVGDVPNLIAHGETGFLLPRIDADCLAEALCRLAALSRQERARMGERARAIVEARYGMDAVAARYLELYRGLVGRPALAPLAPAPLGPMLGGSP